MKVIAKPVDMVVIFDTKGNPVPVRFRIDTGEGYRTIKVDKVITTTKEKLAGNPMLVFECQSVMKNVLRPFQLKYELNTMKWMLFKI